jgi:transcriptional regulator with XRE-family HTH domain
MAGGLRRLPRVTDLDRRIGMRLRELRRSRGLTQQQMADALGIAYQQLHKVEAGRNRISAGHLWQAINVLKVEANEFFGKLEARDEPVRAAVRE